VTTAASQSQLLSPCLWHRPEVVHCSCLTQWRASWDIVLCSIVGFYFSGAFFLLVLSVHQSSPSCSKWLTVSRQWKSILSQGWKQHGSTQQLVGWTLFFQNWCLMPLLASSECLAGLYSFRLSKVIHSAEFYLIPGGLDHILLFKKLLALFRYNEIL
jgi:hypothetical protein